MTGKSSSPRKVPLSKRNGGKVSEKNEEPKVTFTPLYISSAAVAVFAVLYYMLTLQEGGLETFVPVGLRTERTVHEVACSKDYDKEPFQDCKPKRCARVVMDELVTESEARHLQGVAKRGLALGGGAGGASILDLHSGALSKGKSFVNIYRLLETMSEEIFTEEDFRIYRNVKSRIHKAIANEFGVNPSALFLTKPTFFSRMDTKPASTVHDEYWHTHVDKVTYGSFHYTSLLYLSSYGQEFSGGRFIFVDKDVNRTVEPRLGRVSFFTSGSENVHFVEKLVEGERFAITISFTCDPAQAIEDPDLSTK
ncbi:2-oxoglutarate and iron-dependent oxygenase domain-containing protein 3-like [Ylistrum balloti]|uniref:2-oxoglutarate and iron-dependent oxygenase domain-containing protein 3-like n=1 Tax=Ylistrum balloti TaxID=509963 RepID=UPI002905A97C|nr:2-oxoglutarate and iron-dependent oxygenase domain-containing protein 3-like [Ylistrum balloti]